MTATSPHPAGTTLQQQARALGDPTRHSIFRYVADAGSPVAISELTEHLGFNHNAIRQHLTKLLEAGLVVETKAAATGPGRPRLVYTIDPAAESRWGVTGPYERLSHLLAEIIATGDSPVEVGRREGRRAGARTTEDETIAMLTEAMAREGFDPEVRPGDEGVDIVLRNCPFESTAVADPTIVCSLHLGIAEGVAEVAGGVEVDELVPTDPRRPRCRLQLHVDAEA